MSTSNYSTILHVDMDAFYASVAERDDPSLRGKPVVVGAGVRGVVLSANYAARKFGIHAAMPVSRARRQAPQAIFVAPDHARYSEVSANIMEIFRSMTPLVEPLSLDEAFLDVTGARKLLGDGRTIGQLIRARIVKEEGITCSVGIATNKFIAKLASSHCKPNGLLEIDPERVLEFLHPLPAHAIWGVGPKTNEELARLGLRTVGDIAQTPVRTLIRALGESAGASLYELAWGRDYRDVIVDDPDRSISAAETFGSDIDDPELILRELLRLTEKATARLRARNLCAATIGIKVRFADFRTISRSKTLSSPVDGLHETYEVVTRLYTALKLDRARLRLVGVSLEGLSPRDEVAEQLVLGARDKGWRDATAALDQATARFGAGALRPARLMRGRKVANSTGEREGTDLEEMDSDASSQV